MEVRVLSPARFHRLGARARMIRNTRSPASAIRLRSRTGNRYSGSRLSTRTFANLRGTGSVKPVAAVKVDTEKKPGSQVVLSVEVDADQVLKSIDQAYSRLAPRVRIAGFRPGKAPRPMVEREIGWPALRQEALDLILPTAYNSALDEAALDPIDVPRVEVQQFERGQPMRFTATVSIKPEITLKDYKDISVPRPHSEIGENETDAQLEVDKERLITGLAEGLMGQAVGETRDIALTLPADYPKKDLAGQNVAFRITVKSIKERRLPPLDDELAKQVGRGATFDELRQEVHDELQEAAHQSDEQRFENDVLKALDERMEAEVPEALIDREVSRRIRELETRLQEQGVKMERYLQYTNTSLDVLKAEQRPQAVQKVRLELALETVAEREGLTVSDAEVDEAVNNALAEEDHGGHRHGDLRTADPVRAYFRHQLLMRKSWRGRGKRRRGESGGRGRRKDADLMRIQK